MAAVTVPEISKLVTTNVPAVSVPEIFAEAAVRVPLKLILVPSRLVISIAAAVNVPVTFAELISRPLAVAVNEEVILRLVAVTFENCAVDWEAVPMATPSIFPPFKSTVAALGAPLKLRLLMSISLAVKVPVTSAELISKPVEVAVSEEVTLKLVAVTFVNLAVDCEASPIATPSILPAFRSTVAAVKVPLRSMLVTSIAFAVKVPVTSAEEISSPVAVAVSEEVTLKLLAVTFVNFAVDCEASPIATPSILPAFRSTVAAVKVPLSHTYQLLRYHLLSFSSPVAVAVSEEVSQATRCNVCKLVTVSFQLHSVNITCLDRAVKVPLSMYVDCTRR